MCLPIDPEAQQSVAKWQTPNLPIDSQKANFHTLQ